MLIDELSKNMQSRKQTDLILLYFSKAFEKVANEKLLQKLQLYGIRGDTLNCVVTNGIHSGTIPISSGVTQGSVLEPILFIANINDLPERQTFRR